MSLSKYNTRKAYLASMMIFPIFFGLWSLMLGQDRNEDLANYHLYNAFAFLNDKLNIDFSVGSIQSYFNPILDLPYFWLIQNTPPQMVSFFMGTLHGLIYIPLAIIIKKIIFFKANKSHYIVIFLALAGCLTGNFLAGLGNSMGDNLTALIEIVSFALIIYYWEDINNSSQKAIVILLFSGLISGAGLALKLSNVPFAMSMCIALLLSSNTDLKKRFSISLLFGIGVLIGMGIFGGFWYQTMWQKFHNPVFPLYSNIFPNAFLSFDDYSESQFGPKTIIEYIFFPFVSAFDYHRAGRGLIHQFIWPLLETLCILILINNFYIRKILIDAREKFLFYFVLFAYLIWMILLSYQRYIVTIELLTPIVLYLLISLLNPNKNNWKLIKTIVILSILITLIGGFGTFGHSSYKKYALEAEIPIIEFPEKSSVLMPDKSPIGWLVTLFPKDLAFIRLNQFKNSFEYTYELLQKRQGKIYAIFSGEYNWREDNINKWNNVLKKLGLLSSNKACAKLERFIIDIKFRGQISHSNNSCYLSIKDNDFIDLDQGNNQRIHDARKTIRDHGLILDENSCKVMKANIGSQNWRYIWCAVSKAQ